MKSGSERGGMRRGGTGQGAVDRGGAKWRRRRRRVLTATHKTSYNIEAQERAQDSPFFLTSPPLIDQIHTAISCKGLERLA